MTERIYLRDAVDLSDLRPVASVIMDSGRSPAITIYTNGPADRFWVDTPNTPVIVVETTIRKALKLALRNGGWG